MLRGRDELFDHALDWFLRWLPLGFLIIQRRALPTMVTLRRGLLVAIMKSLADYILIKYL
jgi:hypothetical protein